MIFYSPRKRLCARLCALFFNAVTLLACAQAAFAAQTTGALTGRVTDQFGAVVVGASVFVKDAGGTERQAVSDSEGRYVFSGLAPGTYSVRVEARGFAAFERAEVEIVRGATKQLDARLTVGLERQEVTVGAEARLGIEAEANRSALNLRDAELDALPEDAEDLAAALQALAGVPVGPNGGQILIDGFLNTGEPLPPRSSIREVRINQNPFSAENDQIGFGQIQIITRPGTDEWHGQAYFFFTDESFNSRNPFADRRAPYQMRNFGGTLSGPLVARRASFFASLDRRETDDNAIVNAFVLDDELNVTRLVRTVLVPRRPINANVRLDFQLSKNHTLTARYNFFRNRVENAGIGGTFLPERGFDFTLPIHTVQLTQTAVVRTRVVNELRLQYIAEDQIDEPLSERPALNVLGAFAAGGSSAGRARNPEGRLTVQDSVLWTSGAQTLRAGARLRRTTITDISPDDFNGTFTFAGGLAPQLDAAGDPVLGADGQIVNVPITSIERYRRTLLLQRRGLTPAEIRARGGGATQLTIGGGNARATAEQVDVGAYFQDDWRARPNLMLSFGLRYEFQTNIGVRPNFAPRVAFAWAPNFKGGATPSQPRTVVRGGFGVFFDRFNENQVLIANKYAAGDFFRFITADTAALDSFPNVPPAETLRAAGAAEQTVFRIADDLREPYMMQAALGVERQLPFKSTLAVTYIAARTLHALRARNINAPVITRNSSGEIVSRVRPNAAAGNVIQYESSGLLKQHQLNLTFNNRLSRRVSFFANYTLGSARGNTESAGTLPADSYDLRGEYGRSSTDARHTFAAGGTFDGPLGL
ncbi:MAG TPA: carboxypeptidase regulatory-like domain-containing protein, partial [Pyrinomonadaceae bacterium]|nr:carboxypeptidase regulatory-like domain-containing protein [Pyrinomonadaceae bacterium]